MDPDANLREQREIARRLLDKFMASDEDATAFDEGDVVRLAELVEALDRWISGGGFLPAAWRN
jgi:hypothetical protein